VEELKQATSEYLEGSTGAVQSVSCDMGGASKKLCRDTFPGYKAGDMDRFRVTRHLVDAPQMLRRQLKKHCPNSDEAIAEGIGGQTKGIESRWAGHPKHPPAMNSWDNLLYSRISVVNF
jgi:hypothetical protein